MADLTKLQTINFGWSSTTLTFLAASGDYVAAYAYSKGLYLYKREGNGLTLLQTYLAGDSTARCADWRGDYLVVGKTNGLLFFKRVGDELVQLANPSNPTYANIAHVAWDAAGEYLLTGPTGTASVRPALYRRDGDTLTRVISSVSFGGGPCRGLAWNGNYIAISRYVYASGIYYYFTLGKRTGDTLSSLVDMTSEVAADGRAVSWRGDKLFLGVGNDIKSFVLSGDALTQGTTELNIGAAAQAMRWRGDSPLAICADAGDKLHVRPYSNGFEDALSLSSAPNGSVSSVAWQGNYLLATVTSPMEMVLYSLDEATKATIQAEAPEPSPQLSLYHEPPASATIAATTTAPAAHLVMRHSPPVDVGIGAIAPAPDPVMALHFYPPRTLRVQTTTPAPGPASIRLFHDWGATQLAATPIYILEISAPGKTTERIPIRSFQGRLRNGTPSYLQVVIPNAPRYAGTVAERQAGQLVMYSGVRVAGQELLEEIARVDIGLLADQRGGNSQTITISGHGTASNTEPRARVMQGITYRASGSGKRRYRCRLDRFLRPGDTAVAEEYGESIVVGLITYVVDATQTTMEITEVGGD